MNHNLDLFRTLRARSDDILDFVDNLTSIQIAQNETGFDIVDIVEIFYDLTEGKDCTMSKLSKSEQSFETGADSKLSTMSTTPEIKDRASKATLDEWQYLYEERVGIYQFDSDLNVEEAEKNALRDAKKEFMQRYTRAENLSEFKRFFEEFLKSIQPTIN